MPTRIVAPREPSIDLVRILSEGTYTSFPQALKEFISNAHDAYATNVEIRLDEDFSGLTIRDNGEGMSAQDFTDVFASIARSGVSRPPTNETGRLRRKKIGRFGIGALAVVGAADRFTISSVKKGSASGFEASIDLADLRTHYQRGEDLKNVWKFALNEWGNEKSSTHFTEIRVEGLKKEIQLNLQRNGKSLDEFYESTAELSGVDELRWQLGVICPVEYAHEYPIPSSDIADAKDEVIVAQAEDLKKNNFHLILNSKEVKRQISLPNYDPDKLDDSKEARLLAKRGLGYEVRYLESAAGSKVSYQGYLLVQASQLFPQQLRGILIRLRGVAVGWHRTLNLGASASTMLTNMSGEVWVDGLDEALQFDRESFREDHPLFSWLRERIQEAVDQETAAFRTRSAKRVALVKKSRAKKSAAKQARATKPKKARPSPNSYISEEIFAKLPEYVTRLLPQLNGCYGAEWYEGAAMLLRRLAETLVIELYSRRGWQADVQDPTSKEFLMLKPLIGTLNGDQRLRVERRTIDGLERIKLLGDTAAHDFRVRIRKTDLDRIQEVVRLSFERLVFKIDETAPTI